TNGESPHAADLRRNGREAAAFVGKLAEPRHVLTDRDLGTEQLRMHRASAAARVVDIVAVDADERSAMFDQPVGRGGGQERMSLPIAIGAPVTVPAGVDQDGLTTDIQTLERCRIDGDLFLPWLSHDDAGQFRE